MEKTGKGRTEQGKECLGSPQAWESGSLTLVRGVARSNEGDSFRCGLMKWRNSRSCIGNASSISTLH